MKKTVLNLVFVLSLVVLVSSCAPENREMTFPGDEWERWESAEAAGYCPDALEDVTAYIDDNMHTSGMMVVTNGRVVMEYGDMEVLSYLASVRKSILAMLYGIYVDEGAIDLDLTLEDLDIDDREGLKDIERQAKVRHLIEARSGVYHPASNAGDDLSDAPERGSQEPGSYYLYSNWDFNAAGGVFEMLTGKDIYDALEEDLVKPLNMQDFEREMHEKSGNLERSRFPAYHMHLSTRDMARIGHLMLNDGNWNGEQIIPEYWVEESTSLITPLEEMNPERRREGYLGYGYMWWIYDGERVEEECSPWQGAYTGRGALGQWITVVPKLDMVIAHKTTRDEDGTTDWPEYDEMLHKLFDAKLN